MKHDSQKTMFMMVSALVLALAAMLAGPAGARPIDVDGTELSSSQAANVRPDDEGGPQGVGAVGEGMSVMPYAGFVVPYLSQGMGIDAADFGGTGQAVDPTSVIPYLSQDWRVDESQFSGVENSKAATHRVPQSDDFAWRDVTLGAGAAIAALLLAGMALLFTRGRHGGKLAT
jgi:hypothetical protein